MVRFGMKAATVQHFGHTIGSTIAGMLSNYLCNPKMTSEMWFFFLLTMS
jgi:hypothetical protein